MPALQKRAWSAVPCLVSSWRSVSEQEVEPRAPWLLWAPSTAAPGPDPCVVALSSPHIVGFISPFSCLSPPSTIGLVKDQGILHWAMHPPEIPSQRSIPPTHSHGELPAPSELRRVPDPSLCRSALGPISAQNLPLKRKPQNQDQMPQPLFKTISLGLELLGVPASLPHLGYACLPWAIKPIKESH